MYNEYGVETVKGILKRPERYRIKNLRTGKTMATCYDRIEAEIVCTALNGRKVPSIVLNIHGLFGSGDTPLSVDITGISEREVAESLKQHIINSIPALRR